MMSRSNTPSKTYVVRAASAPENFNVGRFAIAATSAEPDLRKMRQPIMISREETDNEGFRKQTVDYERYQAIIAAAESSEASKNKLRNLPILLQESGSGLSYSGTIAKSSGRKDPKETGVETLDPQTSTYFLAVFDGTEFKLYPSGDWYSFRPKITYHTLSLEEAEEKLKQKTKPEKWLMRKKNEDTNKEEEKDKTGGENFSVMGYGSEGEEEEDGEGFDYNEVFDDDDDQDQKVEKVKQQKKFTSLGKQTLQILKDLEGADEESSDSEKEIVKKDEFSFPVVNIKPEPETRGEKRKATEEALTKVISAKRAKVEKKPLVGKELENTIVKFLKKRGQSPTVLLINFLKEKDPEIISERKQDFLQIVRKVAEMKQKDGKKYIVLKK